MKLSSIIPVMILILALVLGAGIWIGGKYNPEWIEQHILHSTIDTTANEPDTIKVPSEPDSVLITKVITKWRDRFVKDSSDIRELSEIRDSLLQLLAYTDYVDTTIAEVQIKLEAKQPEKEYKFWVLPPPTKWVIQKDTITHKIYIPKVEYDYTLTYIVGGTSFISGSALAVLFMSMMMK